MRLDAPLIKHTTHSIEMHSFNAELCIINCNKASDRISQNWSTNQIKKKEEDDNITIHFSHIRNDYLLCQGLAAVVLTH